MGLRHGAVPGGDSTMVLVAWGCTMRCTMGLHHGACTMGLRHGVRHGAALWGVPWGDSTMEPCTMGLRHGAAHGAASTIGLSEADCELMMYHVL